MGPDLQTRRTSSRSSPSIAAYIYRMKFKADTHLPARRTRLRRQLCAGDGFPKPYDDVRRMYFILHSDTSRETCRHTRRTSSRRRCRRLLFPLRRPRRPGRTAARPREPGVLRWMMNFEKKLGGVEPDAGARREGALDTLNAGQSFRLRPRRPAEDRPALRRAARVLRPNLPDYRSSS